ncbi:MAG: RsmD family RNA methyltransferase [Chromatiales bacterium]|nr:RsmD family RNA methyltransferase [Chromatiales bacterium]
MKGKRVLDVFSYLGAWGVQAAAAGAESVLCVDSSALALEGVGAQRRAQRRRGQGGDRAQATPSRCCKALREARERFDVVVLDPPAFDQAPQGHARPAPRPTSASTRWRCRCWRRTACWYPARARTTCSAMRSCDVLLKAGRHIDRFLQIVEEGHQGPDHPAAPGDPRDRLSQGVLRARAAELSVRRSAGSQGPVRTHL